jgi:hypothetical protein
MKDTKLLTHTHIDVSGTAILSVKNGPSGLVDFKFALVANFAPAYCEVSGNSDLLEFAWHEGKATLKVHGTKVQVIVAGRNAKTGALDINSVPLFRAIVARAKIAA